VSGGQDMELFLREDVRIEPLYGSLRAWTHLIPPHTRAVNLAYRYVPALEHFVAWDGESLPRPRVALEPERQPEVGELLSSINSDQTELVELGRAIRELDALILQEGDGGPLEALYARVPKPLRGCVELVYDRASQPSVRFVEGLLYEEPYMRRDLQGARLGLSASEDPGPGLVTPRLAEQGTLTVRMPFDDVAWDRLARSRTEPLDLADFQELLGLEDAALGDLRSLLTERPPIPVTCPAVEEGLQIRFAGHACLIVQSSLSTVVVDPLIAYRSVNQRDRLSFADLPASIDCVVITHGHMDHLDLETLLQLRHKVSEIVVPRSGSGDLADPSLKTLLHSLGFDSVHELDELERHALADGEVVAVPFFGEHADMNVRAKSGYVIRLGGRSVFCTSDARNLETAVYRRIRDALGPTDVGFVGLECEGSSLVHANAPYLAREVKNEHAEQRRTNASDCAGALAMIEALGCSQAYVYAMGLEPWLAYMFGVPDEGRSYSMEQVELFLEACAERGVQAELLQGTRLLRA
jgi:L-ascorbate metabolism protein UlaG (beta-lactamase superfamily)